MLQVHRELGKGPGCTVRGAEHRTVPGGVDNPGEGVDNPGEGVGTGPELDTHLEEMEHHKEPGFADQLCRRTAGLVGQEDKTVGNVREDLGYTEGWGDLARG